MSGLEIERCCFLKIMVMQERWSLGDIFHLVLSQTQSCLLNYIDFHVLSGNSNGNLA